MVAQKKIIVRYANVLLNHAIQNNCLEEITCTVSFLQKIFGVYPRLNTLLHSPIVPLSEKQTLLGTIYNSYMLMDSPTAATNQKRLDKSKASVSSGYESITVHPLLSRFITIIIQQRQVHQLKEIVDTFLCEYRSYMGIAVAVLTVATPLADEISGLFIEKIKQLVPCKEVLLEQRVDSSIIGGYILQIGTLKLDKSLKHQLDLLYEAVTKLR